MFCATIALILDTAFCFSLLRGILLRQIYEGERARWQNLSYKRLNRRPRWRGNFQRQRVSRWRRCFYFSPSSSSGTRYGLGVVFVFKDGIFADHTFSLLQWVYSRWEIMFARSSRSVRVGLNWLIYFTPAVLRASPRYTSPTLDFTHVFRLISGGEWAYLSFNRLTYQYHDTRESVTLDMRAPLNSSHNSLVEIY